MTDTACARRAWLHQLIDGQVDVVGGQLRSPVQLRLERLTVFGVNQLQRALVNNVGLNTNTPLSQHTLSPPYLHFA